MTNRRTLLRQFAAAGLSLMPGAGLARKTSETPMSPGVARYRSFNTALTSKPWLGGYRSAQQSGYTGQTDIRGQWPEALQGVLYRNGPAVHTLGQDRYRHWFDGDGMLQAFRIDGRTIKHQARIIETPKYQAERAANRRLFPAFDTAPDTPAPMGGPDDMNPANISVLAHNKQLYALWEAGSAIRMNPDDLSTVGVHSFSEATSGVPFSAHPRLDRDGSLWNFGYLSSAGALVLWHLGADGQVRDTGLLDVGTMSMPHDMVLTERYIVLLLPPYLFDAKRGQQGADTFLAMHEWRPGEATRAIVIDKNDLSSFQTIELPAQWVFHYGNGYDDGAGQLRFHGMRAADPSILTGEFRSVMVGETGPSAPAALYEYRVDLRRGRASETPVLGARSGVQAEFPSFDSRRRCQRYERLVMLTADAGDPTPHSTLNQLSVVHLDSGKRKSYSYPINQIPEEHLYLADNEQAPERGGWIMGTAYDYVADRTLLSLFDADRVDAGPVASATLPYGLPLGLHGTFVAA